MTGLIDPAQLEAQNKKLKRRLRKLAEEKANLQLVVRLIEHLNPLSDLQDMIRGMLHNIMETIGGTNIKLWYWDEKVLHYVDFFSGDQTLAAIDDALAARVEETHEFTEVEGGADDAMLMGDIVPGAWSWVFPLLVGKELIGIIKLENIHISGDSLRNYLPAFFSHAALILSNELRNQSRQKAMEALRKWGNIFENANWGVVVGAADGKTLEMMNPAFARMHGYSVEELTGRPIADVFAPAALKELPEMIKRAHEQGHVTWESQHQRKNGNIFPVLIDITAVKDRDGNVLYRVVNVQDITERKKAEAEILEAHKAADAANQAKSDFLATMSHEIRTPLNAILGMGELLKETQLTDAQEWCVETLDRSGEALLTLINDILDLSKIEAGRLILKPIEFDLHRAVNEITDLFTFTALDKGLTYLHRIADDAPVWVWGDLARLRQILLNLIGNAVKFTKKGKVEIFVTRDPDGMIAFEVADTGPGIPEEKREEIFHPFTQVDASSTRRHGGTGLGLTISRRLVDLMEGEITLSSKIDRGSSFRFRVPLPPVKESMVRQRSTTEKASAVPPAANVGDWSGVKVLVAEDAHENQLVVQAFLRPTGCAVEVVDNGALAVERVKAGGVDVVLMDIQMPVMDGHAATREIRAWEKENDLPPAPIIALTAHAMAEEAGPILEAGCDFHLTKPIRKKKLLETISRFLV